MTDRTVASGPDTPALRAGIDGIAVKPARTDVEAAADLSLDHLVVDYEGPDHLPTPDRLRAVARRHGGDVRLTTPVRADGFDPLGDDARDARLPSTVDRVLVAGNPAYLESHETDRAIAPRLGAARERHPDAWVGTESIERVAMAAGGTQFELLSRSTRHDVRALRAAGFDGELALYAPVALTDDEAATLDAVGDYVARRQPVARALPDGAATDGSATGRARDVLSAAVEDYALVGRPATVADRVDRLRDAGVDVVVGYPARGVESFRDGEA